MSSISQGSRLQQVLLHSEKKLLQLQSKDSNELKGLTNLVVKLYIPNLQAKIAENATNNGDTKR